MIQKTRFVYCGPAICVCAIAFAGLVLVGCGAESGEKSPVSEKVAEMPAQATPKAMEAPVAPDFSVSLQQIAAAEDFFGWFAAREAYLAGTARSPEVDAALQAKETELQAKSPARPINDSLDIVAFDWKLDGANSSEGKKENFSTRWIIHKKAAIELPEGDEVQLILRGWPDKSHQNYLEGVGQADNKYFELSFWLKPTLSEIEPGSYFLVERKTYKQIPNVPYRMHTFFSQLKKKEDGNWSYVGRYGVLIDLGWFADTGQQDRADK